MNLHRSARFAGAVMFLWIALAVPGSAQVATPRDTLLVTPAWLADHLADADLVVLQVGDRAEYDARHVAGARYVDVRELSVSDRTSPAGLNLELPAPDALRAKLSSLGISDRSRIIVTYSPQALLSATRTMLTLDYAGFGSRSSLLDGGSSAWAAEGRATTTSVPDVRATALSPLSIHAIAVDAAFVRGQLNSPGTVIVDARTPTFFNGVTAGSSQDGPHRLGHIPGARNIPYDSLSAQGTWKTAGDLAALFAAAGIKAGDRVIAYCHIGQQASAVVFAARTLGFDVRLYDGSFEDWSRHTAFPVEGPVKKAPAEK